MKLLKEKALSPDMFDEISPSYDRLNHILSLGIDFYWRKKVVDFLPKKEGLYLLDAATGTGDQLITILENSPHIKQAVGIDPAKKMLALSLQKTEKKSYRNKIQFKEASLLALPFPDASFDVVTLSFGIRNIPDPLPALIEAYRVLKEGGRLLILEFSLPDNPLLKKGHLFYLRHILPSLAKLLTKNKRAYTYLGETIEDFPSGENFCHLLREASFTRVQRTPLTAGIVTLYQGDK